MATYTVKKGDTLSAIAQANLSTIGASSIYGSGGGVDLLCQWNNLSNANYIVVGQVLQISPPDGSSSTSTPVNNTNMPDVWLFGLQANTDNTMCAIWTWSKEHTANYEYFWYYSTGDDIWFVGTKTTTETEIPQCTYSIPSNATRVKFKVKGISEKYKSNDEEVSYWTGDWSTEKIYNVSDNPPKKPNTPTVTLDKYKLTAKLDNLVTSTSGLNADHIFFEVVKDNTSVFVSGKAAIIQGHAEYTWTVPAGNEYKVHCCSMRGDMKSDWSDYSDNIKGMPAGTTITDIRGSSKTSVYLEWEADTAATSYEVQYAAQSTTFTGTSEEFNGTDETNSFTTEFTHYEKTGLESGKEYFFRIRAVNNSGNSAWSEIRSIVLGQKPTAPTTWSSSTTVITGDPLVLYWVHNSKDGSSQKNAIIEMTIDGVTSQTVKNNTTDEDEKDKTSFYEIDTSEYLEGTQIKWRVKTSGVTGEFGDWSIERTVDIYAPPTVDLSVTDNNAQALTTLNSFPFYIQASPSPATQSAIGYHVSITANEAYETVDQHGDVKMVNEDDEVYAKQFNTSGNLLVIMSAENVALENNINYTVTCVVSMDSGLTAVNSKTFKVGWSGNDYVPNAEIMVDYNNYIVGIHPFVWNEDNEAISGVSLAVYRREYDGGFTEIAKGLDNTSNAFVTDPHPALDFARYRIVATEETTGKVSYTDLAGYPIGGKEVIIQWDEDWRTYDSPEESALARPTWSGSMLRLPYNIDVSDKSKPDSELVEYIGRTNPVSYYGTQRGKTATWNVVIKKSDKETLYQLRRLQNYMGDVYVREPSGSGYWANITVSFSQKHCEMTIPVTLDIARVEGGV